MERRKETLQSASFALICFPRRNLDEKIYVKICVLMLRVCSPARRGSEEGGGEEEGGGGAAALRGGADGAGEEGAGEPGAEVPRPGAADRGAQVRSLVRAAAKSSLKLS